MAETRCYVGGKQYFGAHIRYPEEDSCIDGFWMALTDSDTNGKNIDLISGVVEDLVKEVNRLDKQVKCLTEKNKDIDQIGGYQPIDDGIGEPKDPPKEL